ncbi:MAG: hypothetical protein ACI9QD_001038 [Thermoproteota archaeon]|jgi:hypothetical protein
MVKKTDDEDDLIGFRDLFKDEKGLQGPKRKRATTSSLELLSLLNHDSKRLDKLIQFFDFGLNNMTQFDQTQTLIQKQRDENFSHRSELYRVFRTKDSSMVKNLTDIFDNHFKEID